MNEMFPGNFRKSEKYINVSLNIILWNTHTRAKQRTKCCGNAQGNENNTFADPRIISGVLKRTNERTGLSKKSKKKEKIIIQKKEKIIINRKLDRKFSSKNGGASEGRLIRGREMTNLRPVIDGPCVALLT